jgi:two-component system, NarL family, response regulator DevR
MEIYLVEDSSLVRARLAALLEALPGTSLVGEADRADTAIRGILALRPDAVLLDLNLAHGSGFDVLRALSRDAPEIDVYVLSNFTEAPYRELAERLGARGFFDKSIEIERVRDLVAKRAVAVH